MYKNVRQTQGTRGEWEEGLGGKEDAAAVVGAAFVNYPHEFDSFHQKVAATPDENSNEHEYANV